VAAPGKRQHPVVASEIGTQAGIDPGCVACPREEQHRLAAPAKIQIVQSDAALADCMAASWRQLCSHIQGRAGGKQRQKNELE
jgi:hypothetical protein